MDDIHLISTSPPSSAANLKPNCSPLTDTLTNNRQRADSASIIQQSDVSSSRPALLAHDALGPLLFEALDGFFFTINHNCELDFVSDNVGQYLKFSQDELAGRNLYYCVHPSDVGEFSKAWAKKDAGDSLAPTANTDQSQNGQSRGRTFLCRMRTNDESSPYLTMLVSVALHRDPSGSDKTFLICIARRPPLNELQDKPALLGFDQFSSRINLQYDIESLDSSHMKCETIDMNFKGKNFRDYVYDNDIPLINKHFQEVVEKGESKSAVYRFCLHDGIYAFVNTQSKLFSNTTTGKSESIVSTHTIVRLIDNINDLNGNASTRLMKAIIVSNRDLQKNKQQSSSSPSLSSLNKTHTSSPQTLSLPSQLTPPQTSTPPIGTQFALTMLGMHKNASNSLQQHVSSTLSTLSQVQNSLSAPISSPNDKTQQQISIPSPPKPNIQKSSTLDTVSSSDTVEFGSKRTPFSPSLAHSNHGSVSSPANSFDLLFTSVSPTNDLNSFLPTCSPANKKPSSPLQLIDPPSSLHFSNSDIYTTASSPITTLAPSMQATNQLRSSTRLRQLLATKSPPSTTPSPHYHNENKLHSNTFDDLIQVAESPTTTHVSPLPNDLPSPTKRRRNPSQTTNGILHNNNNTNAASDILLKQILGRQPPITTSSSTTLSTLDVNTPENNSKWSSPASVPIIKTESIAHDDNTSNGKLTNTNNTNKLRSDTFLRTLLNDEVRPQKVVVEAPFVYNSRHKSNLRASGGTTQLLGNSRSSFGSNARASLKNQLSLQVNNTSDLTLWDQKPKKKTRQHSHSFGSRPSVIATVSPSRKPGRPKREPTDYLLANPQSTLSDNSLDSFFEPSANLDPPLTNHSSPIVLRRTTRKSSSSNMTTTINLKRSMDNDDQVQVQRKLPKLLAQSLKDDIKMECQDHTIISPSVAIAATRPLNQLTPTTIKSEPDIFDRNPLPTASIKKLPNNSQPANSQSKLLRSLIRTPQIPSLTTKKDAPLYDLLQNLDSNDPSVFSTNNNSTDSLEQYPTSSSASKTSSSKDDYLAALLSSDPQQPNEISFIPVNKQQQTPTFNRSTSNSSDSSRIAAIVNDLFNSTNTPSTNTGNNSSDDFLSLLDHRDFLECLNDPTTIDSILSQNSNNMIDSPFSSTTPKRSEKDEKAISEIYKTLVTSFNPGPSSLDLSIDHSPFSSITGDFLFADNMNMSIPPNRTVPPDPSMPMYRQQQTTYTYQTPQQQQQQSSSNNSQFSDCLPMDIMDNNTFPPNVSLSPMNTSYLPSANTTTAATHMETNPMMMYSQQPPSHIQHHQAQNQMSNTFYRQPSQAQQQTMYNNFGQPSLPPNQIAPSYYPMQPQQTSSSSQQQQQRISTGNPSPQINKRQALLHQQRTSQQNNQQLQLHMSMNVTLPHMTPNQQQQTQQQQQQSQQHRPMMNTYNDLMMPNGNNTSLQQDFHRFSPSVSNNNPLDLPYSHDLFMSSSPAGPPLPQQQQQQQKPQNRHMNVMQSQQQQQPQVPSSQMATNQV
ncbi:unnamed protein product [Adineta steineri]|uniref:PAS domain-containing protein n=1 Tax=Adineta steineri TaxID=433720 RepID=A0A814LHH0_9BILA|nr:unnamed protein product [Adineta steineri]CAF1169254.1 unnamed protein product [Adineta steineri]